LEIWGSVLLFHQILTTVGNLGTRGMEILSSSQLKIWERGLILSPSIIMVVVVVVSFDPEMFSQKTAGAVYLIKLPEKCAHRSTRSNFNHDSNTEELLLFVC